MTIKQKLKNFILIMALLSGIVAVVAPPTTTSAKTTCATATSDTVVDSSDTKDCSGNNGCGIDTALIKCDNVDVNKAGTENTAVWSLLLTAINILTAGVGLAAVAGIVYASILYTTAGGNADQTKKALEFIRNVVIGIIAYAVMFSFLNFIIPGGLFAS